MSGRWNHNLHYQPVILAVLPATATEFVDVGGGEGMLARQLRDRAAITAIGRDPASVHRTREQSLDHGIEGFPIDCVIDH